MRRDRLAIGIRHRLEELHQQARRHLFEGLAHEAPTRRLGRCRAHHPCRGRSREGREDVDEPAAGTDRRTIATRVERAGERRQGLEDPAGAVRGGRRAVVDLLGELHRGRHRLPFTEPLSEGGLDESRPEHLVELIRPGAAELEDIVDEWLDAQVRQPQPRAPHRLLGIGIRDRLEQARDFRARDTRGDLDRADVLAVQPLPELPDLLRQRLDRGAIEEDVARSEAQREGAARLEGHAEHVGEARERILDEAVTGRVHPRLAHRVDEFAQHGGHVGRQGAPVARRHREPPSGQGAALVSAPTTHIMRPSYQ